MRWWFLVPCVFCSLCVLSLWALWPAAVVAQQEAPPFPLRLLTSLATPAPQPGAAAFNATVLLRLPGGEEAASASGMRAVQLHVDGPKARVHHGKVIQIERQDLRRLWMLDISQRTFLDLPLAQDSLPPAAVLRQAVSLQVQGEEVLEGVHTIRVQVRMPAAFVDEAFLPVNGDGELVEMTVWYAPALGVLVKRDGPGTGGMTMTHIQNGTQAAELFLIPDGYRMAGPPSSFPQ